MREGKSNINVILDLIDEGLSEGETNGNECNTDPIDGNDDHDRISTRSKGCCSDSGDSSSCVCGSPRLEPVRVSKRS